MFYSHLRGFISVGVLSQCDSTARHFTRFLKQSIYFTRTLTQQQIQRRRLTFQNSLQVLCWPWHKLCWQMPAAALTSVRIRNRKMHSYRQTTCWCFCRETLAEVMIDSLWLKPSDGLINGALEHPALEAEPSSNRCWMSDAFKRSQILSWRRLFSPGHVTSIMATDVNGHHMLAQTCVESCN